jgi:hypothetical protein
MQTPETQKPVLKTWKPTVAGILEIVVGSFSALGFIGCLIASFVIRSGASLGIGESDLGGLTFSLVSSILVFIAGLLLALGVFEIIAGISALQRKRWGLALAGSIVAALPGSLMGILAIVFLAMSKGEFV